jgi:hypothetical protein
MGSRGNEFVLSARRAPLRLAGAIVVVAVTVAMAACSRPRPTTPPPGPPTTTTAAGQVTTTTAAPSGGGAGPAVDWNPPAEYRQPLADVWAYTTGRQKQWATFKHFEWDQIMSGHGSVTYCVRWEANTPVTAAQRDRVAVVLEQQFNQWMEAMTETGQGWNGWPYPHVDVRIVGWAARDRSLMQWTDAGVPVFVGTNDAQGVPNCPTSAGAGLVLWLTPGMSGGTGGDWGQRIGTEYFMGALGNEDVHILEHEMGHGFGLEDFYDWSPSGVGGFVMKAGSAMKITEFDKWMLRDWWRHLKPRYAV